MTAMQPYLRSFSVLAFVLACFFGAPAGAAPADPVEADRIVAGAKAEIDQEAVRAKEQLREQVASLVVSGAEKILRREINTQAHADILATIKQDL